MKNKLFTIKNFLFLAGIYAVSVAVIGLTLVVFKSQAAEKAQRIAVRSVSSNILANGEVTAQNQATLHFQTGGKLASLPFKEGDSVSAGQTIATLDSYTIQKQLTAALNTYRSTRDSFDQTQQNQGNNVLQNQQQKVTGDSDSDYLNQVAKRLVDQNQARNTAAPPISSGLPQWPAGIRPSIAALRSGSARNAVVLLVSKYPGAIAFTLILLIAHSQASSRVSPASPLFAAVYEGTRMPPWNASSEAMLMILPREPCAIMRLATACERKNALLRLTSITASQSPSVNSIASARRMMPALLTRMSSRP